MSMQPEQSKKKYFEYKGQQYDYEGLQDLAFEKYGNELTIATIQKRASRKWSVRKIIATPNNANPMRIKDSILNLFLWENNLTQQEVAHHSDISIVTLRKLVNETEFSGKFGIKTLKALSKVSTLSLTEVINELMYASQVIKGEGKEVKHLTKKLNDYIIKNIPYVKAVHYEQVGEEGHIIIDVAITLAETMQTIVVLTKNDYLSYTLDIEGVQEKFVPNAFGENINLEKAFNKALNSLYLDNNHLSLASLTPLKMVLATHGYTTQSFIKKMSLSPTYFVKAEKELTLQPSISTDMLLRLADGLNITLLELVAELELAVKECEGKHGDYPLQVYSVINRNPFIDFKKALKLPNGSWYFTIKYYSIAQHSEQTTEIKLSVVTGKKYGGGGTLVELSSGVYSEQFVPTEYNLDLNIINILNK